MALTNQPQSDAKFVMEENEEKKEKKEKKEWLQFKTGIAKIPISHFNIKWRLKTIKANILP